MSQRCTKCGQILAPSSKGGVLRCLRCGCEMEAPPPPPRTVKKSETVALDGLSLGGYRVTAKLGSGPRATMYVGEQIRLRRLVTLKFLSSHLTNNKLSTEDFAEAGRRAAPLIHPNIVKVYDEILEEGYYCIVGEFVSGISLASCVAGGESFSPRAVLQMGVEAADALQYAANQGVCHGNVCPANILRAPSGKILLSDFCHSPFGVPGLSSTQILQLRGLFVAPERMQGGAATTQADVFSLGCVLYFALAGYSPYTVQDFVQMLEDPEAVAPPPAPPCRWDVLPPLIDMLQAMLSPVADKRPQSLELVKRRFQMVLNGFRMRVKKTATQIILSKTRELGPARRRLYKRLPTDTDVAVIPRSTTEEIADLFLSKIADLSENGCFVASPRPLPIGTFVTLEFALEQGGPPVQILGLVRWVEEDPDRPGMGVQFLEVTTEDRKNLRDYVDVRLASEMSRTLTQSSQHRAVLRVILSRWDSQVSWDGMMQITHTSRPLLERVLTDFQRFHLLEVSEHAIKVLRPPSHKLVTCLVNALAGLETSSLKSESPDAPDAPLA